MRYTRSDATGVSMLSPVGPHPTRPHPNATGGTACSQAVLSLLSEDYSMRIGCHALHPAVSPCYSLGSTALCVSTPPAWKRSRTRPRAHHSPAAMPDVGKATTTPAGMERLDNQFVPVVCPLFACPTWLSISGAKEECLPAWFSGPPRLPGSLLPMWRGPAKACRASVRTCC